MSIIIFLGIFAKDTMLSPSFWKRYFEVYDTLNMSFPYRDMITDVIKNAQIEDGHSVLDAGVGTGNAALIISNMGAKVTGVDFSPDALDVFIKKVPKAIAVQADISKKIEKLEDESFDRIISVNTIYNISRDNRISCALELKRLLKKNGVIVLCNMHRKFRPLTIYWDSIKKGYQRFGFFFTLRNFFQTLIPTLRILYYNLIIQHAYKMQTDNLFEMDEQEKLLRSTGFSNVSQTKLTYSNQAVLNWARR